VALPHEELAHLAGGPEHDVVITVGRDDDPS
jgi:hypothetical protein